MDTGSFALIPSPERKRAAAGVPRTIRGALALAAVIGLLCASPFNCALADGPGWTAKVTIRNVVVTAGGGVNVRVTPDVNNCVSQSGYGPKFISIYPSHPGINRIKADLLAAYLSGGVLSIYLSDSICTATEVMLGE